MRQLTEQEKSICNKQIKRMKKEISDLKDVSDYAERKLKMLEIQWNFEDFAKPLERKTTRENTQKTIENAQRETLELKEKIQNLNKQMKEGVREPSGIN